MNQVDLDMAIAGLAKLSTPEYKRDVTKLGTVKWLLDNLRTRNQFKPQYKLTMIALIQLAKSVNGLKAKEIASYEEHVKSCPSPTIEVPNPKFVLERQEGQRPKITLRSSPTGRTSESKPERQDLPRVRA